ncbi:MAG TPA: Asp-tRNA(Asn)/Glu-tRNA(Gln) amidotransferase subunit GatB [Thermoanaerobaculia bacterium]|nr:Asp-tRNA(Asn)/Glu-tRNA(Gln) amidotransferase subunit GatB [Thermoanaerobaculia bacterium]
MTDSVAAIGLEVHVQLKTRTKLFCGCPNHFGDEPNRNVCAVCLGYPGALPVANGVAIDLGVQLALALGCVVHPTSVFARKNYFYPDLPKGYQISQYEQPLAEGGSLPLSDHPRRVAIRRLHLEEDAGKLLHENPGGGPLPGKSLVDFNRCGVPLVELVTEPAMTLPAEAQDFLQTLHRALLFLGVSDGNLEEGSLRCDANVSLRRRADGALGTKVEVKNLNSFKHVARAIEHEIERQSAILEHGGEVVQETRSFDAASGSTSTLRGKEEAHDYRYFPDPDLPPVVLSAARVEALGRALPELPWSRRDRLVAELGLGLAEASQLTTEPALTGYFEAVVGGAPQRARAASNWVRTEVLRELHARHAGLAAALAPERLAELIDLVEAGKLSNSAAKQVFAEIWESGERPAEAVERLGLGQVSDESRLRSWVREVVDENPAPAAQLRAGESKVLGFLVGQVMRRSAGRADPAAARRLLEEAVRDEVTAP